MITQETERFGAVIINFQERVKLLEHKRRRQIALPQESIRELSRFLYGAAEGVKLGEAILPSDEAELLDSLSVELRRSLVKGTGQLLISRQDIDRIGVWFEVFKPQFRVERRNVASALLGLDKRFVMTGGLKNLDFDKNVKEVRR